MRRARGPEVRSEFAQYRADLAAASLQPSWASLSPLSPTERADFRPVLPVRGAAEATIARLTERARLERRSDADGKREAWFRGELDASFHYVGFADPALNVGCVFVDGPELDACALYQSDVVSYLPRELAELLVVEGQDPAARELAARALGLARDILAP